MAPLSPSAALHVVVQRGTGERGHVTGIERVTIDLFAPKRLAPHEVRPVTSDTLAGMIAGQQLGLPLRALLDRNALFLFPGFPPGPFHPNAFTLLWFAAMLELVGGALLLVGLFTRPVAFVLSGQMAFAYFIAHASKGFFPAVNGGDAAILFCFIFLYIAAAGPGLWSVDAMRNPAGEEPLPRRA